MVSSDSVTTSPGGGRPPSEHLVITVHGIRTYGAWQDAFVDLLRCQKREVRFRNYTYGYFSSIAFLIPLLRWIVARRFRQCLVAELANLGADARVDIIAHSFGTYLVGRALKGLKGAQYRQRISTVIFAGSVLK